MPSVTGTDLFIGREREMAEIVAALDGAVEGRGGLVMLAGEPGIGKTRLTEELAAVAKERGALVTWGACYEDGSAPPYWPWTQAIRSLLTEPSGAVLNELEPRAAVIAEIVPEVRDVMPDMRPAPEVDPAQARFRLFDSVTSFLNEIATLRPVVLVLDDLHWADRSTLDLLEFVAREVASRPMLIVGGYRDMELSRRHPLSETLATLARIRGFRRILLRGLDSGEVGRMVEAIGDIGLPSELIEEIHVRTEGNPFFVGEVTRDLAREAAERGGDFDALKFRIPEGVREAVGIRLNKLSEECNQVLRTAAVIGREFDFQLLAALNQEVSDDALLDLTEEAIAAGTIKEVSGPVERYEFTHALIQQTLTEELTAGRRVRLHIRIISAIEELYADRLEEHVAELAHHCLEAETVVGEEKVIRYARMAGTGALAAYAWTEARGYFEQALQAMGDDFPDAERAVIFFGLGEAELQSLSYPNSQRGWDNVARAFDLYEKIGDTRAAVAVSLQSTYSDQLHIIKSASVYSRALEMVEPESADAGLLLTRYAAAMRFEQEDDSGSMKALEQALGIARRTGDRRLETSALFNISLGRLLDYDFQGSIEVGLEAVELARETDQEVEEAVSHWCVATSLIRLGDPEAAWQHSEAGLHVLEKIGRSRDVGPFWNHYVISYLRGDRVNMEETGGALESRAPNDSVIRLLIGIGAWHTGTPSDLDDLMRTTREAGRTEPQVRQRVDNVVYLALAARLMDRPQEAIWAGEMARSILSLPKLTRNSEAIIRMAAGLAAVTSGDVQDAAEHYRRLHGLRGSGLGWTIPICANRLLGLLAYAAGMREEAVDHFETALEFTGKAGYRLEEAWTCYDYAESLIDSDEPAGVEKAVSLIDDGLEITRELGLVAIEKRLIDLQKKTSAISSPIRPYPDGLTEREVEVLRLLAAGSTNQQIAADLVIAPSTAAKHVANILGKTGSSNRAEAASYANQQGLVKTR